MYYAIETDNVVKSVTEKAGHFSSQCLPYKGQDFKKEDMFCRTSGNPRSTQNLGTLFVLGGKSCPAARTSCALLLLLLFVMDRLNRLSI